MTRLPLVLGSLCVWLSAQTPPWNKTLAYVESAVDRYHQTCATLTIEQSAATGTSDERFIGLLYHGFFGRLPSAAERAYHLSQPRTRANRALDFFSSEEFRLWGKFVAGAYAGSLNREPEYSGWLFQRDLLARTGGNAGRALVANVLASPERALTFGNLSRRDFIRLLYMYVLGRNPSLAELDFQVQFGAENNELAHTFLRSAEFADFTRIRLVPFLAFAALLQRDMTEEERTVMRGKSPEEVIDLILNSPEGMQLTN